MNLFGKRPTIDESVFVAPNATVVGDVSVAYKSSVWYGAVVRGDMAPVEIGGYSCVHDRAVIQTTKPEEEGGAPTSVRIGNHVVVGAGAVLRSCTVEGHNRIGAGSVVNEGALIEEFAVLAEGSVVHPGRRIPGGQLWAGNPAQFVRNLTKEEMAALEVDAEAASGLADEHSAEFLPESAAHMDAEGR